MLLSIEIVRTQLVKLLNNTGNAGQSAGNGTYWILYMSPFYFCHTWRLPNNVMGKMRTEHLLNISEMRAIAVFCVPNIRHHICIPNFYLNEKTALCGLYSIDGCIWRRFVYKLDHWMASKKFLRFPRFSSDTIYNA